MLRVQGEGKGAVEEAAKLQAISLHWSLLLTPPPPPASAFSACGNDDRTGQGLPGARWGRRKGTSVPKPTGPDCLLRAAFCSGLPLPTPKPSPLLMVTGLVSLICQLPFDSQVSPGLGLACALCHLVSLTLSHKRENKLERGGGFSKII